MSRFRVPAGQVDQFAAAARVAIQALSERPGFIEAALGQSTDEDDLRIITTRWDGIGAYRRALSAYEVKIAAVPLLSLAVDEPSAFEVVHSRTAQGVVERTSGLAADAGSIGLGFASGPDIAPVVS